MARARVVSYGLAGRSRRCDACRRWVWGHQNCWSLGSFLGRMTAWVCEACFDLAWVEGAVHLSSVAAVSACTPAVATSTGVRGHTA